MPDSDAYLRRVVSEIDRVDRAYHARERQLIREESVGNPDDLIGLRRWETQRFLTRLREARGNVEALRNRLHWSGMASDADFCERTCRYYAWKYLYDCVALQYRNDLRPGFTLFRDIETDLRSLRRRLEIPDGAPPPEPPYPSR